MIIIGSHPVKVPQRDTLLPPWRHTNDQGIATGTETPLFSCLLSGTEPNISNQIYREPHETDQKKCESSTRPTWLFNQFNHHSNLSQNSRTLQKSHLKISISYFNRDPPQLSRGPLKAYTCRACQIKAKPCKTLTFQQPHHQSPIIIFNPKTLKIPPPPQQSSKHRNHKIRHPSIPAPTDQLFTSRNSTNQKPPKIPLENQQTKKGIQNYW